MSEQEIGYIASDMRKSLDRYTRTARIRGDFLEVILAMHSGLECLFKVHWDPAGWDAPREPSFADMAQQVVPDLSRMKLDALAMRASRKDFYDLYAIAQYISLRNLLDLAPAKYPSTRDFEAMVVRYMVYFDRAEQETPPILLQRADWETVKAFFREQAVALSRGWLG